MLAIFRPTFVLLKKYLAALNTCLITNKTANRAKAKIAPQMRTAMAKPPMPTKNVPTTAGVARNISWKHCNG